MSACLCPHAYARMPLMPLGLTLLRLVVEAGAFRNHAEETLRQTARLVHTCLPLADRLLTRAQLLRQLLLGQPQVLSQRLDARRVPPRLASRHGSFYTETCVSNNWVYSSGTCRTLTPFC